MGTIKQPYLPPIKQQMPALFTGLEMALSEMVISEAMICGLSEPRLDWVFR